MDEFTPEQSSVGSLRRKVLIPFFAILLSVGAAATIGSLLAINSSLIKTSDERLIAFQQQIYQDIRNIEGDLIQKSKLLELSYRINYLSSISDTEINTIEQLVDESLIAKNMRARFIEPNSLDQFPNPTLKQMFSQAQVSHRARIRFTTDIGPHPALSIVTPVIEKNEVVQFILLQSAVNQTYLKEISDPLNVKINIFDIDGTSLVKSHDQDLQYDLAKELLAIALTGENYFATDSSNIISNRILYNAIPLGTTDLLLLSIALPMTDFNHLITSYFVRIALFMTLALLSGAYIYFRLVSRITKPVEDMLSATHSIAEGNLDYRLNDKEAGEFEQLALSFNNMMGSLSTVYDDRLRQDRELTIAQEELRYKDLLEQKNKEIEAANKELGEHNNELSVLLQINQDMSTTLDLSTLFDKALNALKDLINSQIVILLMYNQGEDVLEVSHSIGIGKEDLTDITFSLSEGISGETARSRAMNYVPDLKIDKRYLSYKKTLTVFGSMLSIPLVTHNKLCGVLNLHKDKINGFTEDEITLSQAVASQAAIAIENAQLYKLAKELSITDELTGLANRRHFQDILDREVVLAKRYTSAFSLIMCDIDHFKKYNDFHGHLQGDIALKKVAICLLNSTRGIDIVCRFGGEEFIILLPKTNTKGAMITAEKLRRVIETEIFEGENESQPGGKITLSLGVSTFPDDTSDISHLMELADQSLYEAKRLGRNKAIAFHNSKKKA